MESEKLLIQLEKEFAQLKSERNLSMSLEELDEVYYLKDHILSEGYVSPVFSRQLSKRIAEHMISWVGAFHSVLMPNPQDMVTMTEAKSFSQPEKQELFTMTAKIMKLIRSNSVAGINKDKKREAQFIEDSFKLWNSELKPLTAKFEQKLYDTWKVQ